MRALGFALASSFALATVSLGCVPDKNKEPDWQKPPEAWNVKGDDLSFGEKNLDAFNSMSGTEREAHLEALKGKAGGFKGQAKFGRSDKLGDEIADKEHGNFEVYATVEEPVLFEITIEYRLFSAEKQGAKFPPGALVEFTGTLVEVVYKEESKPRKLEIKVKDVQLTRLDA